MTTHSPDADLEGAVEAEPAVAIPAPEPQAAREQPNLLDVYDATASIIFASLCRVAMADRPTAERLLGETFTAARDDPAVPLDRRGLLTVAHRLYIDEAPSSARARQVTFGADSSRQLTSWSRGQWKGIVPEALASLTPSERAALNLAVMERYTVSQIAKCLGCDQTEVMRLLASARVTLEHAGIGDSPHEVLQQCELWLDDVTRDRVRAHLRAPRRHSDPVEQGDAASSGTRRVPAARWALAAAAIVIVSIAFVRWSDSSPDVGRPIDFNVPVSASASTASTSASTAAASATSASSTGGSNSVRLDLANGESTVTLGADLDDLQPVRPDAIVRYSNGMIGLSWHGPCNRPAANVQLYGVSGATGLILTTGAFPALSCIGMPKRWTTVFSPLVSLPAGPILPLVQGRADESFTGFADVVTPNGSPFGSPSEAVAAGLGSALIDQGNQAWVYVDGCSSIQKVTRYQSPVGPVFEVHTPPADLSYCRVPDPVQSLRGPRGGQFPQPEKNRPAQPIDCQGPFQSATDVLATRPYTTDFNDGDWSTWDGCLVRSDVIYSRSLEKACGWQGARTISFAEHIGDRIVPIRPTLTFLRNPDGTVPGDQPRSTSTMPPGTIDSGLRFGTEQLWLPTEQPIQHIYLVDGDSVEAWPMVTVVPSCG